MEALARDFRHLPRPQVDTNGGCAHHDEVKHYNKNYGSNLHDERQKDYTNEDAFETELKVGVSPNEQYCRYSERYCPKI